MLNIFQEVQEAEQRIRSYVRTTPLVPAPSLSAISPSDVYLKLENLQHTGSFKVRGAFSRLTSLSDEERCKGVVTASSGNHGLAVAFALNQLGIPGTIFLPENVTPVKYAKLQEYDVQIKLIPGDGIHVETTAINYATQKNIPYISPYNDAKVIGGQGTIGVELHQQQENIDCLFVAVGGGGMISGTAGFLKKIDPGIRVIGCEPQNSRAMSESVKAGRIVDVEISDTLSDGTAGGIESESITFEPCSRLVDDWVDVTETEIVEGMRWLFEHHDLVVEGAAGVVVAAFLKRAIELSGSCAALVMCGANIDEEIFRALVT
ncbi:MAG: threonine/serine dehydratase [Gammaproteobacteria bacterium]|nr:threonine/serine dehydratase [Gammaproteobacteria bacterium]